MRYTKKTRNFYDRVSRSYDLLAEPSESALRQAALDKLDANPGETILDVGSGTGQALLALAQVLKPSGKLYGLDISEKMNRVARQKFIDTNLHDQVVLVTGDAVYLPFQENKFDIVFMSFTLELFPTPTILTVLKECQRVLRSNGRVCLVSLYETEKPGVIVRVYEYLHRRFPWIIDCRPIDVSKFLKMAGFEIEDISKRSLWGLPVAIVLCSFNGQ